MKTFLHKSLSKVFLLVVLFLSGCSTTTDEINTPPSDELIDLISGKTGRYFYNKDANFTINDDDGLTYSKIDSDGFVCYTLEYLSSNGTDCITFKGLDNYSVVTTVVLSDITSLRGKITISYYYVTEQAVFIWISI